MTELEQAQQRIAELEDLIFQIQSTASMIVETQTEMHPAHRELVQMIWDATMRDAKPMATQPN